MESELISSRWLSCAASLAVVSVLYYYLTSQLLARRRRTTGGGGPAPGPAPFPVVGNLLSLRGSILHHELARLARIHGPVMTLKLGLTTAVVVSSSDAAREALTKHDRRLAARAVPDCARALGFSERSIIWLPSSNPLWKTMRGIVATSVFSPRSLAAARAVRERKVREFVSCLRGRAGQEVDVGEAVFGCTLSLVTSVLCSVDLGAKSAHGIRELVEDLVEAIAKPNVSDLVPFLRPFDLQGWRRWSAKQLEKIFTILDGIINSRVAPAAADDTSKDDDKHGDFLDSLLELVSMGKIPRDSLRNLLFDVFSAGSDTMSRTVEWAMAELLRNPGVMTKLRAEIDEAFGGKETIEEPEAMNLPYLQAVVKEAMRLHPVAPILLPHKAVEDGVEIGGYAVPKGTTVIFNVWAMMRDPAAWERPGEFVPERFLLQEETAGGAAAGWLQAVDFRGKDFEFIPFGSGRRVCPGLPMAERVMPYILASLLHAFEWRLPDGVTAEELDVRERFTTSNVLAVPLRAVPVAVGRRGHPS